VRALFRDIGIIWLCFRTALAENLNLGYAGTNNRIAREDFMAEHVMHKKESKKAPKKTLKEKREDKKTKKKSQSGD
jgi:hypothetical protein